MESIKQKDGCIYKIECKRNGFSYIGSTLNYERRIKKHIKTLREGNHHNYKLQKDWNKYNEENFSIEVIEHIDENDLPSKEKEYIDAKKETGRSYNINDPVEDESLRLKKDEKSKKKKVEFKVSKEEVIHYLNKNFSRKLSELRSYLHKYYVYDKDTVDKWFLKSIDKRLVEKEPNIIELLQEWYKDHNIRVIKSPYIKGRMKRGGIKNMPKGEILVELDIYNAVGRGFSRGDLEIATEVKEYINEN